jgi:cutinase
MSGHFFSATFTLLAILATTTYSLPAPDANARPAAEPVPVALDTRQSLSPIRNDLSGSCKPVTIIFARGTSELGNVGSLAGPPFFNALGAIIGNDKIAVQGVNYPASIPGYLVGGSPIGSDVFAAVLSQAAAKCPSTKIVVSGYR